MSDCGHESSIIRRPCPTGGLLHHGKIKKKNYSSLFRAFKFLRRKINLCMLKESVHTAQYTNRSCFMSRKQNNFVHSNTGHLL